MFEIPADKKLVLDLIEEFERAVDTVKGWVETKRAAMDSAELWRRVGPEVENLKKILTEVTGFEPAPNDRFITPAGAVPAAGQVSLDDFGLAVAAMLPGRMQGFTAAQVAATGRGIARVLGVFGPIIDAETYLRWWANIRNKVTVDDAATFVRDAVLAAVEDMALSETVTWPDGVPSDDAEKEAEELNHIVGATPPKGVTKALSKLIRGTRQSDKDIGREVHKKITEQYVAQHGDHLVIVDGRARLEGLNVDSKGKSHGFTVSKIWRTKEDTLTGLTGTDKDKVGFFWDALRQPPDARIRPDIADMKSPAAAGIKPADDWGWFEIKPWPGLHVAWAELYLHYLPKWNTHASVINFNYQAGPGIWQPTTVFPVKGCVAAAVTVPPGVIGYALYELEADAEAACVAVLSTLASLLAAKMLARARAALESFDRIRGPVSEFIGLWTVALALMALMALVAAEVLVAAELGALMTDLAAVAGRLSALIARMAPEIPLLAP